MTFLPGRFYVNPREREDMIFSVSYLTDQRAFGLWLKPDGSMGSILGDSVRAYENEGWLQAENFRDALKLLRNKTHSE